MEKIKHLDEWGGGWTGRRKEDESQQNFPKALNKCEASWISK